MSIIATTPDTIQEQADFAGLRPLWSPPKSPSRPSVRGKFLYIGQEKIYLQGVTYGPFRPDDTGNLYHTPEIVERDFSRMVANNINAIRVYTAPPLWLLDLAQKYGLWVMVGLEWGQYITFLDDRMNPRNIEKRIRSGVQSCANHPAVFCFALGNEIPASIVRWYGRRKVEKFIYRLYQVVKDEAPDTLVTYVNYPTTEYLQLPFIDFFSFNVYLEARDRLEAYLPRLQNIAGDKPLVMAEIGLDSQRNGEEAQAVSLDWQIKSAFTAGCAGAFVFAWTDEWHTGGQEVEDWDFGLTRRDRSPKLALEAVCNAFSEVPFPSDVPWPRISVILCSYNGARTIRETCEALKNLDYPALEVIVVNDGSTDSTSEIVREYGFHLIDTANQGLSSARNTGLKAATGEIIAYLDDDAVPDPHWLKYLARMFLENDYAGIGGPNISPPGDGAIAECVSNAPGNPTHILLTDEEAEHIPGCNMAFRHSALQAVGGFDPRFRIAGDDIDICWRIQQEGWKLGFSPAAMVWHHRRNSIRAFLRQQVNYGQAEGLLEQKWPYKYNSFGHLDWQGRLYGNGKKRMPLFGRWRVYHGVWGSRYFQSIYESKPGSFLSVTLMPEWYLIVSGLIVLSAMSSLWKVLYSALPLLALAICPPLIYSIREGFQASFTTQSWPPLFRFKLRLITTILHILQPLARLSGRLSIGLNPWRRRGLPGFRLPWRRKDSVWSESWQTSEQRLEVLESFLRREGTALFRGGEFDRWDLEVRGGLFGAVRTLMAIELHGRGKQMLVFRSWPKISVSGMMLYLLFGYLIVLAALDQAWIAFTISGLALSWLAIRAIGDCASAMTAWLRALEFLRGEEEKKLNA